jgi:hypothetical protein
MFRLISPSRIQYLIEYNHLQVRRMSKLQDSVQWLKAKYLMHYNVFL